MSCGVIVGLPTACIVPKKCQFRHIMLQVGIYPSDTEKRYFLSIGWIHNADSALLWSWIIKKVYHMLKHFYSNVTRHTSL